MTADTARTFGIEMEYERGDRAAIARDLHAAGMATTPEVRPRNLTWVRTPTSWRVEMDPTLDEATGVEVISHPVLVQHRGGAHDTLPTWTRFWDREMPVVLDSAVRHGARITAHTAMHVHADVAALGTDRFAWHHLHRAACERLDHHRQRGLRAGAVLSYPVVDPHASGEGVIRALSGKSAFLSTAYWRVRRTIEWRVPDAKLDLEAIRYEVEWLLDAVSAAAAEVAPPSPYALSLDDLRRWSRQVVAA